MHTFLHFFVFISLNLLDGLCTLHLAAFPFGNLRQIRAAFHIAICAGTMENLV